MTLSLFKIYFTALILADMTQLYQWCILENKVPKGDDLKRRGIIGPCCCARCKKIEGTVEQLFLTCPCCCARCKKIEGTVEQLFLTCPFTLEAFLGFQTSWQGEPFQEAWSLGGIQQTQKGLAFCLP